MLLLLLEQTLVFRYILIVRVELTMLLRCGKCERCLNWLEIEFTALYV